VLVKAAEQYVALRRKLGFALRYAGPLILQFAAFAATRGETHISAQTAVEWAKQARSAPRRTFRLRLVIGLARHLSAEDPLHEVPADGLFGPPHRRPIPFIFTEHQVCSLIRAARSLPPKDSFRAHTYATLFSLLASTGLRISEALGLRLDDVTADGLVIRMTKFRKSRMVPLHRTAAQGMQEYITVRQRVGGDRVFVHSDGRPLPYAIVRWTFKELVRGLHPKLGRSGPQPRLHSFRHTFAVRVLEASPTARLEIARHQLALTTYLGHVHIHSTYWYLQATPHLLRDIASQCEQQDERDRS
jgi:integrase/recombinase XerD